VKSAGSAIIREAAGSNYRFSAIVMGVVKSAPFQMRQVPAVEPQSTASATTAAVRP